jgi:hypothetical protein
MRIFLSPSQSKRIFLSLSHSVYDNFFTLLEVLILAALEHSIGNQEHGSYEYDKDPRYDSIEKQESIA